ncbi:anti-repressor SinI family protein [Bacillus sp. FJAT-29814]|nr:anti-repressor SinI family protein [Bacillus sp. FJAT-29814]
MDAHGRITELDEEWVALILEALKSGISADEIREFLNTH